MKPSKTKRSRTKRSGTSGSKRTRTRPQGGPGETGGEKLPHHAKDGQFQRVPAAVLARALAGAGEGVTVEDLPTSWAAGGIAEGIAVEDLRTGWAVVKKRLVDRLWLVKGPSPYLMHVEQQSSPDADISLRMFVYRALILDMQAQPGGELKDLQVRQYVLYTGLERWNPSPRLELDGRSVFTFHYVDARDLDPSPFLASENPDAVIFAALCRGGDGRAVLHEVLQRVKELPEQEQADDILKLGVWCAARNSWPLLDLDSWSWRCRKWESRSTSKTPRSFARRWSGGSRRRLSRG